MAKAGLDKQRSIKTRYGGARVTPERIVGAVRKAYRSRDDFDEQIARAATDSASIDSRRAFRVSKTACPGGFVFITE